MIKRCANSECSKIFVPQRCSQIYCSTKCQSKAYYQNNKKYFKKYRYNNKEYMKKYREHNKERINKKTKEYKENNKQRIKEYMKEYRKEYYNTHPITKTRAASIRGQSNRRARKRNAGGTYTEADYIAKGEAYGWKCRYCGIQLSYATAIREHSIPLARGGDNSIANIFPSCQKCNSEKNTMTGIEYMTYRMRRKYLARRK